MSFLDLSQYDVVAVDTEGTGLTSKDRPVGLSISAPDGKDRYYRWGHERGGNNCTVSEVADWLEYEQRKNPKLTVVMHEAGFDLRMLAYKGVHVTVPVEDTGIQAALLDELEPSFSLDALSQRHTGLSKSDQELNEYCAREFGGQATRKGQAGRYWRAPGDVVEPYACGDSRMTLDLHQARRAQIAEQDLEEVYRVECGLLPVLLKMHLVGVRADIKRARETKELLRSKHGVLKREWDEETGSTNPGSHKQMVALFERLGLPLPTKRVKNKKTGEFETKVTFESEQMEKVRHRIGEIGPTMKKLKHFETAFIDSYVLENADDEGLIHGEFHSVKNSRYGTTSGRFSSGGELNLQNVPKRDKKWAPMIRGLFVPYHPGQEWTRFDYSQIEYRFLAHYAGGNLRRAYAENPDADFHRALSDLVGWGEAGRDRAKTLNFAICYGQGVYATAEQLGISPAEAKALLDGYHSDAPEIKTLYDGASRRANRRGYILTWGGRRRRFVRGRGGYLHTHKALNALLQGSAADLIKYAMLRVGSMIDWDDCLLHLTVHDELDFSTTPGEVGDRWRRRIQEAMEDDWPRISVPIRAECEVGPDWGHLNKWSMN